MRFIKLAFFFLHVVSATDATNCVSDSVGEPVCDTELDRTTLLQNRLLMEEKETNEAALEDEEVVIQNIKEQETYGADPEDEDTRLLMEEGETNEAALEDEEVVIQSIKEQETYGADPDDEETLIQESEEKRQPARTHRRFRKRPRTQCMSLAGKCPRKSRCGPHMRCLNGRCACRTGFCLVDGVCRPTSPKNTRCFITGRISGARGAKGWLWCVGRQCVCLPVRF